MSLSRQTLGCAETRNANDADVANSLKVVDATILKSTNSGSGWLRYNGDGYGDCHVTTNGCPTEGAPWAPSNKGTGHIWPVLSEERAQQELATGRAPAAGALLNAIMAGSSGVGLMPEQDWDAADVAPSPYGTDPTVASIGFVNGKPAGSAAPLTWGAGSFVRLVADLTAHRSVETPSQTVDRYVTHQQHGTTLTVTAPADQSAATGTVTVTGTAAPGATIDIVDVATDHGSATTNAQAIAGADGSFSQAVTLNTGTNTIVITSTTPDGATAQTTRTVVEDIVEGTLLYDAQDPTGDDNGPGNYAYPTASDFHPGAYDMTDFQVYDTGSTVTFRVQTRDLTPTFGSPLGAQLIDVYVHQPAVSPTSTAASYPQRNYTIDATGAWSRMLEVQGFGQRFIDASGATPGTITISANQISRYITFSVTKAALGGTPASGWGFTVTLTGQDGFSSDQARAFTSTPGAYSFGVCAVASTGGVPGQLRSGQGPQHQDPRLQRWVERPLPPVRLDQDRRTDPQEGQPSGHFKQVHPELRWFIASPQRQWRRMYSGSNLGMRVLWCTNWSARPAERPVARDVRLGSLLVELHVAQRADWSSPDLVVIHRGCLPGRSCAGHPGSAWRCWRTHARPSRSTARISRCP